MNNCEAVCAVLVVALLCTALRAGSDTGRAADVVEESPADIKAPLFIAERDCISIK